MSDQFAQQVMRLSVAQICLKFGELSSSEGRAFDLLVDVAGKFIEKIGRLSRRYTEHDSRTESSLLDVLQAFHTLEPNAVDWRALERMCREVPWKLPVTSGVPDFPVDRKRRRVKYGEGLKDQPAKRHVPDSETTALRGAKGDRDRPAYVPAHFPTFPEKHTYSYSQVPAIQRENNPAKVIDRSLEEKKEVQKALVNVLINSKKKNTSDFVKNSTGADSCTSTTSGAAAESLPPIFKR